MYPVIIINKKNGILGLPENIPVPIYLDERLTGIAVMSQKYTYTFSNDTVQDLKTDLSDGEETSLADVKVKQRAVANTLNVQLKASRKSIAINALIAALEIAFQRANMDEYSVSYFNANAVIFQGKISEFNIDENNSDTSVLIDFSIMKEEKFKPDNTLTLNRVPGDANSPRLFRA